MTDPDLRPFSEVLGKTSPAGGNSFAAKARAAVAALLPRTSEGKERLASACVFVLFIALFVGNASLLRPVLQNGDSAVYNQQIESRSLVVRSPHVGYMALGVLFNALLPFGTDLNMNIMVLTIGVLGLAALYDIARTLSGSRWAALAPVLLGLGLRSELQGMFLSEVDVVAASLIAIAYACLLRARVVLAGLVFGYSVLVTPLSGPMVVVFLFALGIGEGGLRSKLLGYVRNVARFGVAALLVYLPPVLINRQDYLYGGRGLFVAARAAFSWPDRLARSAAFIAHEAGLALPLYLAGVIFCLARPRRPQARRVAIGVLVSVLVMALAGERFQDVPVQLPNLLLAATLLPVLIVAWPMTKWLGALAVLVVSFFTLRASYASIIATIDAHDRQRLQCVSISEQSRPYLPVLVGISGWGQVKMFERLTGTEARPAEVLSWSDFLRKQARWLGSPDGYEIWFFRRVKEREVTRLLTRYTLEARTAGSRRFQVLVPIEPSK